MSLLDFLTRPFGGDGVLSLDTFCNRLGLDPDLLRAFRTLYLQFCKVVVLVWVAQKIMGVVW